MLLKQTFQYFLARGVPAAINLLAIVVYTRLLEPEQYGEYAIVFSSMLLATALFCQWLRMSLLRFLPAYAEDRTRLLTNIVLLYALIVAATALVPLYFLFTEGLTHWTWLALLGVVVFWTNGWYEISLELVRSDLKPIKYGYISTIKAVSALAFGAVLAYAGMGAAGLLIGLIVSVVAVQPLVLRDGWLRTSLRKVDKTLIRSIAAYGLPLTVTFTVSSLIGTIDRYQLGYMSGVDVAGVFSVASDFGRQSILVLIMMVNLAAFPLAVKALERSGEQAARDQMAQNWVLLIAITLPVSALTIYFASELSQLLFGPAYAPDAAILIPWVVLATALLGMRTYYFDQSFYLAKSTRVQIYLVLLTLVVKIVFNLLLIPRYGGLGAAYSGVIAFSVSLLAGVALARRYFRLEFCWKDLLKASVATAMLVLACHLLHDVLDGRWFIVNAAISLGFYLMVLLALDVGGYRAVLAERIGKARRK